MRIGIYALAALLTAALMSSAIVGAQATQETSTFKVAGHPGEARLVQIDGRWYVELETLARLTQGTLSFKGSQTTLTLAASDSEAPVPAPQAKAGFSRAFLQAGIEDMGLIREWRIALVSAVQNNVPVPAASASAQRRQAEKGLALASAAVSTDDDRSGLPLLSAEFNNMQKLSDLYLAMSQRSTAMSPETFGNSALEQQILTCARGFVAMTEAHEFQDQAACH